MCITQTYSNYNNRFVNIYTKYHKLLAYRFCIALSGQFGIHIKEDAGEMKSMRLGRVLGDLKVDPGFFRFFDDNVG